MPLAPYLAENDIVVNCTLQDTAAPLTYLQTEDLAAFRPRQPHRRRVLRRGHGLRVGPADDVRRADVHRRATASTTTRSTTARRTSGTRRPGRTARRCCPFLPTGAERAGRVGRRRDDQPRDRDPRRPGRATRRSWPSRVGPRSTPTWSADPRSRPRLGEQLAGVARAAAGRVLVPPMTVMKFCVAGPARHDVLVQVRQRCRRRRRAPWFMPDVEAMRRADTAAHPHRLLGQSAVISAASSSVRSV